jgi:hypothetical protein
MILELDPNKYKQLADFFFKQALAQSGMADNGGLSNSLEVTKEESGDGYKFILSFNEYGIFLDQGVKGVKSSSKAPQSQFGFKASNKGIFNVPGIGLSMKQRGAVYWYGIKPYPWVENFLASLGEALERDITDEMVENITSSAIFDQGTVTLKAQL